MHGTRVSLAVLEASVPGYLRTYDLSKRRHVTAKSPASLHGQPYPDAALRRAHSPALRNVSGLGKGSNLFAQCGVRNAERVTKRRKLFFAHRIQEGAESKTRERMNDGIQGARRVAFAAQKRLARSAQERSIHRPSTGITARMRSAPAAGAQAHPLCA